jgi:hypothetical protein
MKFAINSTYHTPIKGAWVERRIHCYRGFGDWLSWTVDNLLVKPVNWLELSSLGEHKPFSWLVNKYWSWSCKLSMVSSGWDWEAGHV